MVREALKVPAAANESAGIYFIGLGQQARLANLLLADKLRAAGIRVELELEERSFKAQMRSANRCQAAYTLIRGESEMEKSVAIIKNMADGSQCEISESELFEYISTKMVK